MKRLLKLFRNHWGKFVVLLLIATSGIAISVSPYLRGHADTAWRKTLEWAGFGASTADSGKIFWCPMHPEIKSTKENYVCPICNMALVELEGGIVEPPDHLTLTAQQVQQTGVATEPVLRRQLYREIDTTGRIAYDERQTFKITNWVQGRSRIEKLHVSFMGQVVENGEALAEIYSPSLYTVQKEYLLTKEALAKRPNDNSTRRLLESSRQKLKYQGITDEQIRALDENGGQLDRVAIHAKAAGTVTQVFVKEGQYVNEGDVLFEIANLSQLWLYADIFEDDLQMVQVGDAVDLEVRGLSNETFSGKIAFIDPMVMSKSRVIRVRIDVPNADGRLIPGMFARVELRNQFPQLLAVPENAVLWSGQRTVVITKDGEGAFRPREVEIGKRWMKATHERGSKTELEFGQDERRYHEVVAGLSPGEQVVTDGAFLLSAESQFQSVLAKMLPPADQRATLEEAMGQELATGIRNLLESYYAVSKSLANDQLDEATTNFGKFSESAKSLRQSAEQQSASELSNAAGVLVRLASDLVEQPPKTLKEARTGFGRISQKTIQLLSKNGGQTLLGEEMFAFHCGMSGVGYENWLWWSNEKLNPYMGKDMFT